MPSQSIARSQGRNRFGRKRYGPYVTKGYLKAIVGVPEAKWYNFVQAPVAVTDAGVVQILNGGITQGTGQSNRIGQEVTNKSLHIRLDARRAAADSFLRVIIFWWKDGSIAPPTAGNILETISYQSPLNKEFGKSFWVKFDRTYTIASGQSQLQVDEIWRKMKCKTEWNDTNPSIGISHNSLYMLYLSSEATAANQPLFSFTSRLNYLDM